MRPLHGHQDFVLCVGFSPDGRWLASGGADNRLFLWDLHAGSPVELDYQPHGWVACVAFSPDGRWLAVGEHHGRLTLIERETRRGEAGPDLSRETISGLAFAPDGKRLAWCDYGGRLGLWSVGREVRQLLREPDELFAVALSPGGLVAAGGRNGRIVLVDSADPDRSLALRYDDAQGCRGVAFDPRERAVVAGLGGGVMAWRVADGEPLWRLEHPAVVSAVALSADGRLLASGGWDGQVRLFDRDPDDAVPPRLRRELDFGQPRIHDLALSRDGMVGAVAGQLPEPLLLWDVD